MCLKDDCHCVGIFLQQYILTAWLNSCNLNHSDLGKKGGGFNLFGMGKKKPEKKEPEPEKPRNWWTL